MYSNITTASEREEQKNFTRSHRIIDDLVTYENKLENIIISK